MIKYAKTTINEILKDDSLQNIELNTHILVLKKYEEKHNPQIPQREKYYGFIGNETQIIPFHASADSYPNALLTLEAIILAHTEKTNIKIQAEIQRIQNTKYLHIKAIKYKNYTSEHYEE